MNESQAQKYLLDAKMRRELLSFLWHFRMEQEARQGLVPRPMPSKNDDQIQKELKRIIGFK